MIESFIIQESDGIRTHTGRVVCHDEGSFVMVLTEPSSMKGRTVRFTADSVIESKALPLPSGLDGG